MPEPPVIAEIGRRVARFSLDSAAVSVVPEVLAWSRVIKLNQFMRDVDFAFDQETAFVAATTLMFNLMILGLTMSSNRVIGYAK